MYTTVLNWDMTIRVIGGMNNHTRYCMGAPVTMLEDYLCEDGRPIYIGGVEGSYEVNPLFKGYDGMWRSWTTVIPA